MIGPKWKPAWIASGAPLLVRCDEICICIAIAAYAALAGSGNTAIDSSPIVLTTRPPCSSQTRLHDLEAAADRLQRLGIAQRLVELGAARDVGKEYGKFAGSGIHAGA